MGGVPFFSAENGAEQQEHEHGQGHGTENTKTCPQPCMEVAVSSVDAVQQCRGSHHNGERQRDLEKRGVENEIAHGAKLHPHAPIHGQGLSGDVGAHV